MLYRNFLLSFMFLLTLRAAPPWHDANSPYRFEFEVTQTPNDGRTGVWLEVPVCGVTFPGGEDVKIYTADGRLLPKRSIGPTRNNCALVLCGGRLQKGSKLYAYIGSRQRHSDSSTLIPGLYVAIRLIPERPNLNSWKDCRRYLRSSPIVYVQPMEKVELGDNPYSDDDTFAMEFFGHFRNDKREKWEIFLACDDAGFIFLNNRTQPVFELPGHHSVGENARGKKRSEVKINAGLTPFHIVVLDGGEAQGCALGRYIPGKRPMPISGKNLLLGGKSKLLGLQKRQSQSPAPFFSTQLLHYYGHPKAGFFTAFRLRSLDGSPLRWSLSNGQKGYSAVFEQIAYGTAPVTVNVQTDDGKQGEGKILLKPIPPRAHWWEQKTYDWYSRTMLAQALDNLVPSYLAAYFEFFQMKQLNPNTGRIAAYLLTHPQKRTSLNLFQLHLAMATCGASIEPELAHQSWLWLSQNMLRKFNHKKRLPPLNLVFQDYFDFELYVRHSITDARKVYLLILKHLPKAKQIHLRCLFELQIASKKYDDAAETLQKLWEVAQQNYSPRLATQANNYLASFEQYLSQDFLQQAAQALFSWIDADPTRVKDGSYILKKALFLQKRGWKKGALTLIENALAVLELPPFMPDLQYQRTVLLHQLGRDGEARKLCDEIIRAYPKHPTAEKARKLIRQLK